MSIPPPYPEYRRPGSRLRLIVLLLAAFVVTLLYYQMPLIIAHLFAQPQSVATRPRTAPRLLPVASHELAPNTHIALKDIKVLVQPKDKPMPDGAILDVKQLLGKVTRADVAANTPFTQQLFLLPPRTDTGLEGWVEVRLDRKQVAANVDDLKPGDLVMLYNETARWISRKAVVLFATNVHPNVPVPDARESAPVRQELVLSMPKDEAEKLKLVLIDANARIHIIPAKVQAAAKKPVAPAAPAPATITAPPLVQTPAPTTAAAPQPPVQTQTIEFIQGNRVEKKIVPVAPTAPPQN